MEALQKQVDAHEKNLREIKARLNQLTGSLESVDGNDADLHGKSDQYFELGTLNG